MKSNGRAQSTEGQAQPPHPDVEVPARPIRRRSYSAKFKLKVLEATDQLEGGEIGAYLRREGLYWSLLTTWRRQRSDGVLTGLAPSKVGRQPKQDPRDRQISQLERDKAKLSEELRQFKAIIEVQKKVLLLCSPTVT